MRFKMKCLFHYNLESGKAGSNSNDFFNARYGVRCFKTEKGLMVEIGDGYRHELFLEVKHWNRLIKLIRKKELDKSGVALIIEGFLGSCLPKEYRKRFISAIQSGVLKKF